MVVLVLFLRSPLYQRAHSRLGEGLTVSSLSRATSMRPGKSGPGTLRVRQALPTDLGGQFLARAPQRMGWPIASLHGAVRQRTGVAKLGVYPSRAGWGRFGIRAATRRRKE